MTHLVGLDLAWGERARTGVAVLEESGRLVHLSSRTSDDDVVDALAEAADGPVVVAVDAPLVVTNPTGRRRCEAELSRDFARFHAGTHPTNLALPHFADGPRGGRLAERIGLDVDPASTGERRGLEVYPHAATVALFRLPRTLPYKSRPGRTVASMRTALWQLVTLLESLADGDVPLLLDHPDWRRVRTGVGSAVRKSELGRLEDEVDAVVCAYVALLAHRTPNRLTIYGDAVTGAIVTPTLPPGLELRLR